MASDHVLKRGKQYYLRLAIPPSIRKFFPSGTGKPRVNIIERLGTDSPSEAQIRALRRAATYRELFKSLREGQEMTQEQIGQFLSLDMAGKIAADVILPPRFPSNEAAINAAAQKHGQTLNPALRAAVRSEAYAIRERVQSREETMRIISDPEGYVQAQIDFFSPGAWKSEADKERYRRLRMAEALGMREAAQAVLLGTPAEGETISQAAEAWFDEMQRDPSAAVKQTTLDGHRLRVRAFVEHCGDIPLTSVTRAMAADFLTKVSQQGKANRTTNAYATTMAGVFKSATHRGRFTGNNPFDGQKRKAGGESYEAFTVPELQTLFDSFKFEIAPKHSPETALPWVSLIAAYTGMRLEEIAQLKASDIRNEGANGSTVTVIDIHNGGSNTLKNESSARLVAVHSRLVHAGFLDYVKALPEGSLLFPGLTRRTGKIGARLGELFRKRLESLGLKRERLCFHSFRHTVAGALEAAAVSQTDAARVLGHTIAGMSYGTYSSGPGLKRLAAVIEEIAYPGLRL
jgi:integrase